MKKIIKKMRKNNTGFSLLEILLAVVLLAIVVTPLIQTIYTSMSLNKKARILMGATDVGQHQVEYFEAQTYEDISSLFSSGHYTKNVSSNGFNYFLDCTATEIYAGSEYSVYEIQVDVYYKVNNSPTDKDFMASYKGSVFNKYD